MRSYCSWSRRAAPAPCDDIQASLSELLADLDWFLGQGQVAAVVDNLLTGGIDQVGAQGEGDRLAVGLKGERPVGATEFAPGVPLAVGLAAGSGAAGEEAGRVSPRLASGQKMRSSRYSRAGMERAWGLVSSSTEYWRDPKRKLGTQRNETSCQLSGRSIPRRAFHATKRIDDSS